MRRVEDIRRLLNAGADKISINTAGIQEPRLIAEAGARFGAQCIVVAIDAKRTSAPGEPAAWQIFTHGGRNPTGLDAIAFARTVAAKGAGELLVTSMDRDGTRSGYDLALIRAIADAVLRLRDTPAQARAAMGAAGRAYVSRHFERGVLAARYLDILRRVGGVDDAD